MQGSPRKCGEGDAYLIVYGAEVIFAEGACWKDVSDLTIYPCTASWTHSSTLHLNSQSQISALLQTAAYRDRGTIHNTHPKAQGSLYHSTAQGAFAL